MHNDIDVEGCRVLARVKVGLHKLTGIGWLRGGSVGKFGANGCLFEP